MWVSILPPFMNWSRASSLDRGGGLIGLTEEYFCLFDVVGVGEFERERKGGSESRRVAGEGIGV